MYPGLTYVMVKETVHLVMMSIQNKVVDNSEYAPLCLSVKIPKPNAHSSG